MGVTVWLKGSRVGSVTDEDGKFRMQAVTEILWFLVL
ncbi:hypothetical protein [Zunongwangia endophytica]|nr:hypothetical protein [Zunongwangia endophytica]MDN3596974.1 hypothetical protein [Zunongwangia endophytica]